MILIRKKEAKRRRGNAVPIAALFTFFCSLLICSCDKEDPGSDDGTPVAVQFGSGNIATTRTGTTAQGETQWVQGDGIGIFMISTGATDIDGNIKESADNVEYSADNGNVARTGFSPAGSTIYYPNNGDKVDFIAYYPWKATGSGSGEIENYNYPVDVSDQSKPEDIDVLYSNNAQDCGKSRVAVDLQFFHALSKLEVEVVAGTGAPDLTGLSITIEGRYQRANLSLSDGVTLTGDQNGNIEMREVTAGEAYEAILIPQAGISGSKATLTVGNDSYEWDLSDVTFERGKKHSYTITVNKTTISVSAGDISDWTGKDTPPTEGVGGVYYKVGDYYPDPKATTVDGGTTWTGTKPIGVVYWVDPSDSRHGQVVSLDELTSVQWADNSNWNVQTNVTDRTNGRVNMLTMSNFITSQSKAWSNFPAFDWVHTTKNRGTADYSASNATGVWYLPALDELSALYSAYDSYGKSNFNNRLTSAGGTGLSNTYYWSSSEYVNYFAYIVHFSNGTSTYDYMSGSYRARCVLAF